ncbi:MAG: hypothetical protein RL033_3659 [Pseudomonadota bacterium]
MLYAPNESAVATAEAPVPAEASLPAVVSQPATAPIPLQVLLLEGAGSLLSGLGAVVVTWQLTRGLSFVNEQRREAMLPFNLSAPTNTLFQYAAGLVVALAVLVLYARGVAPRLGRVAQRLDLLAATALLLLAGLMPGPRLALAALGLRAGVGAWLLLRAESAALEPGRPLERLAAWAPLTGILVCAAGLALVLPSGLSTAIRNAPTWVLLVAAAPVVLFFVEETLSGTALRWERRIGLALGLVAIPCLTYRVAAAYFDFATIVGPVNDLLHGKDILQGVVSTYGFLFTYALAGLFWLFRVNDPFLGTAVVNALAFSIGYGAILLFLAQRIQRISLCLASMGVLLALHFYHLHVPMSWLPQSGFLRFGGMLPVFFLLYAWPTRSQSRGFEWAFAACSAVAILWTIEVGLYIIAGLAAAGAHQIWLRAPGDRRVFRLIGKTAAAIVLILACVGLRVLVRHGHWPIWADLLHFQKAFSAGLAMSPVTSIERWPVPILVYLITLFVAVRAGHRLSHAAAWVFLAAFGLASMVYPLGKAGIWDLGRVVLPATLLTAVLVGYLFQAREQTAPRLRRGEVLDVSSLAPLVWFAVFACAVCFVQVEVAPQVAMANSLERSHRKPIAHEAPAWHGFLPAAESRARFESDLAAIHAVVPPDAALPLLSRNDTLYYVFGERRSVFKNSFYPHFFFKSDIDEIARDLETSTVGYLFVDNSAFQIY